MEEEELRVRRHPRALALPLLVLLVALALSGYLAGRAGNGPLRWAVAVVAAAVVVRLSVLPWLRWLTGVLVVTDRVARLEQGVLRRRRREVPLSRVVDVEVDRTVGQRLLGAGTLVLATAGESAPLVVRDVPRVRRVADLVADLVDRVPLEDRPWPGQEP